METMSWLTMTSQMRSSRNMTMLGKAMKTIPRYSWRSGTNNMLENYLMMTIKVGLQVSKKVVMRLIATMCPH